MDGKAAYHELVDAWYKMRDEKSEDGWWEKGSLPYVFGRLLARCGWTVEEWNAVVKDGKEKGSDEHHHD